MLLKITALFLVLFFAVGMILTVASPEAAAGAKKSRKFKKNAKRYKKYSKPWWRAFHNRSRQRKAVLARKRALRGDLAPLQADGSRANYLTLETTARLKPRRQVKK